MALPNALRHLLLSLLARALLAPGFSLQSFLSQKSVIPSDERVTTVANLASGAGVVRPPPPAPPPPAVEETATSSSLTSTSGGSESRPSVASSGSRVWQIDA